MIKVKKRKIIKEAEATTPAASSMSNPNTSSELTIDAAVKTSKLINFSNLSNTAQTLEALKKDFANMTGATKYQNLAQFLASIGIIKADVSSTASIMK